MSSLTLIACIVAVAVIRDFVSAGLPSPQPPRPLPSAESEAATSGGLSGFHDSNGCYWMYTLTSKGVSSGTNSPPLFQFWKWTGSAWQFSPWIVFNNGDHAPGHWDLFKFSHGFGSLPADWLYVKLASDWWQIENIFMWDKCANKVYMYYCGGCWVTNTGTWIQRKYP